MYYSASTIGSQYSAIGLATSLTAEPASWADKGLVFQSTVGDDYNAIDPNLLVDASGRWWLTFGAWWEGIYTVELDPLTGNVKSGATPIHVAKRASSPPAIHGPSLYRHAGYYYLFVGFDVPPGNAGPAGSIRVGRSTSPTGPFVDRNGVDMLTGGGTMVLESHDYVLAPTGPNVVRDGADDQDLLVYHWYDQRANNLWFLGINTLSWDAQDWPYVS
jgi:arabinan endo-1,5-alpha-L-arabinosidase